MRFENTQMELVLSYRLPAGMQGPARMRWITRYILWWTLPDSNRSPSRTIPGGPEGTRTPYLFHAMEALYQLSYRPPGMVRDSFNILS